MEKCSGRTLDAVFHGLQRFRHVDFVQQCEVLFILLTELGLLTLLAQPIGWGLGYLLSWLLKVQVSGEVMRGRLIVGNSSYAFASGIVIVAALFSALVVRERINKLDLVAVLKTRD